MSIEVTGPMHDRYDEILTPGGARLPGRPAPALRRAAAGAAARREERQRELAAGGLLDFLTETKDIREADWRVAEPAPGLVDRRVEITGPTDAKMTINALNSGREGLAGRPRGRQHPALGERRRRPAQPARRDRPHDRLHLAGGQALRAARRRAGHDRGPAARLAPAREAHPRRRRADVRQPGRLRPLPLPLRRRQLDSGSGPYFYLPKMESHLEARLWNDVFVRAQEPLGIPRGTIRATVLIETFPAAFEMEEILYELREHSAGLNAGRWDYMFSVIKKFRTRGADFLLPDRNAVTMTVPFMRAYTELLVRTCHKRGAHAIGGMAAFIPSRRDPRGQRGGAREGARRQDPRGGRRLRRLLGRPPRPGADLPGGLRRRARRPARTSSTGPATTSRSPPPHLLDVGATPGERTEAGLRNNVSVGIQYLASLAARHRRGGDHQPDGGRGHRRDLPLPGVAVAAQRRRARRHGRAGHPRAGRADRRRGDRERSAATRPTTPRRGRCSSRWPSPTTSPTSSPCPPTSGCPDQSTTAQMARSTALTTRAPRPS